MSHHLLTMSGAERMFELQSGYLLLLNAALTLIPLAGSVVNGWMLWISLERRHRIGRVAHETQDRVALLTVRRATRLEAGLFAINVLLLILTVWSLMAVLPLAPERAVSFYFGGQFVRSMISVLCVLLSTLDLRDRKLIMSEDEKSQTQTPSRETL